VKLTNALDLNVNPGDLVLLSAQGTTDPDGNLLTYRWWAYKEAGSYLGSVQVEDAIQPETSTTVPADAKAGQTIHIICEVTDNGTPPLTRYQRVVLTVSP